MVELKIKDVESLEAIVRALQKNGYPCNSSIHWGKGKINYFSIQLDLMGGQKAITSNTEKALEAICKLTHGGDGMKQFAIMDGDMFFQRLEPNERYAKHVSGIQTNRHSYSEYTPIFGHEEKWMDGRTVISYLAGLVEFQRWEGDYYHAYALICREER